MGFLHVQKSIWAHIFWKPAISHPRPAQLNTRESFLCFNTLWGTRTVDPPSRSRPRFGFTLETSPFSLDTQPRRDLLSQLLKLIRHYIYTHIYWKKTIKNYYLFSTFAYKFPKRFWLSEILFSIFSVWSSYRSSYNYPRLLCISLPFITLPLPLVSQKSDWSGYVSETFWCSKYRSFKMSARNWSIL